MVTCKEFLGGFRTIRESQHSLAGYPIASSFRSLVAYSRVKNGQVSYSYTVGSRQQIQEGGRNECIKHAKQEKIYPQDPPTNCVKPKQPAKYESPYSRTDMTYIFLIWEIMLVNI